MEKQKLQSFISKYYLGGNCEAVKLEDTDTGISCRLIDEDQTVVGGIKWTTEMRVNGEIGVNHTSSLIKMLAAIGDDVKIEMLDNNGQNYAMRLSEGSTRAMFMLADTTVIPQVPDINNEPNYLATIDLNDEFVTKFIKAKNALPDAKNFAVKVTNGQIKFIINYSTVNTDNISFEIPGGSDDMDAICFSAEKLKEILVANKSEDGKLFISAEGLAKVEYSSDEFQSTYWLVQLQN